MAPTARPEGPSDGPDGWVMPGEFHFCHRCGMYLTAYWGAGHRLCARCLSGSVREAEVLHVQLSITRSLVAEYRRRMGVRRLFWMGATEN